MKPLLYKDIPLTRAVFHYIMHQYQDIIHKGPEVIVTAQGFLS